MICVPCRAVPSVRKEVACRERIRRAKGRVERREKGSDRDQVSIQHSALFNTRSLVRPYHVSRITLRFDIQSACRPTAPGRLLSASPLLFSFLLGLHFVDTSGESRIRPGRLTCIFPSPYLTAGEAILILPALG